jgi:Fur family ferric uptake transcriptional regulator
VKTGGAVKMKKQNSNSKARKILKVAKLYNTECRTAILDILLKAGNPLNHEQIMKRLGKKCFDKVTIYRTLESFCEAGLVHKAFMQKRAWHFESAQDCSESQCHPHFTCTNCGHTHCLTGTILPTLKSPYKGFIIQRQQVRLEGLCPACA